MKNMRTQLDAQEFGMSSYCEVTPSPRWYHSEMYYKNRKLGYHYDKSKDYFTTRVKNWFLNWYK